MGRGFDHCRDNNIDPKEVVEARLYDDMLPFRFQVVSTVSHSLGAIEGVRKGVFSPPMTPELDYGGLQKYVADTRAALKEVSAEEVNGFHGRDMKFEFRDRVDPVHGGEFPSVLLCAQLLFPRLDGLRHPALEGRTARQARLHGAAQNQDLNASGGELA